MRIIKQQILILQKGRRDLPGFLVPQVYGVGGKRHTQERTVAASPVGWCWRRVGDVEMSVLPTAPSLSLRALDAWVFFKLEMIRMDTLGST